MHKEKNKPIDNLEREIRSIEWRKKNQPIINEQLPSPHESLNRERKIFGNRIKSKYILML